MSNSAFVVLLCGDMVYSKMIRERLLVETKQSPFLYHGSAVRGLKYLDPFPGDQRNPEAGPVVFATPFFDYATCFMGPTQGSWITINKWGIHSEYVFICSNEKRYRSEDRGGAIYKVDSDGFAFDEERGGGLDEWMSKTAVRVLEETTFSSVIDAMIDHFVQVFFVSEKEHLLLDKMPRHGLYYLMQKTSENQRMGKNVLPLERGGEGHDVLRKIRWGNK